MKFTRDRLCLYSPAHPTRTSMEEIADHAVELGVGGLEFRSFCQEFKTPDREAGKQLAKMTRERGLAIPCFSVAREMVQDTLEATEFVVKELYSYAEICADNEIPYLHHTIALNFSAANLTEEEREARFQYCLEHVLKVCEYANRLGVRTIIEDQGFVFNGVKNCDRLCTISDERIGIVADLGNIMFVDEKPEDFIRAMGNRVCHAHLKDYFLFDEENETARYKTKAGNFLKDAEMGTGDVNFAAVMDAFDAIDYKGFFALEFSKLYDENEAERVIRRLEAM